MPIPVRQQMGAAAKREVHPPMWLGVIHGQSLGGDYDQIRAGYC